MYKLNKRQDETILNYDVSGASMLHTYSTGAVDGYRPIQPRAKHQKCSAKLRHSIQYGQIITREHQDIQSGQGILRCVEVRE